VICVSIIPMRFLKQFHDISCVKSVTALVIVVVR